MHSPTETIADGNCADGIDNDFDGYTDEDDAGCNDCTCASDYEIKIIQGEKVYVDCSTSRCWAPTASDTKTWGPDDVNKTSCIDAGSSYPACNYCDTLAYAGFTDWVLPTSSSLFSLCISGHCPAPSRVCFGEDGGIVVYWGSNQYEDLVTTGYSAAFATSNCVMGGNPKTFSLKVRCTRV
ncbi:MAG: hypothetical protein WAX07_05805 [Candidatus Altiarchaeia archaeon]